MASTVQAPSPQPDRITSPDAPTLPTVFFKAKKLPRPNRNFRKRPAFTEKDNYSDDGSESDGDRSPPGANSVGKRRRRDVQSASSASSKAASAADTELFASTFEADRKAELTDTNDATRHREPTAKGPIRAGNNVRTTTLMDYAPDVCKDYQKSGWCGFGDSCKYLHDRTDMKKGWELDRDWEVAAAGRSRLGGQVVASASQKNRTKDDPEAEDDESDSASKIPSKCIICEQPYKSPIVTACGHYFCESCALRRYRKDPTCMACGAGTNGVFKTASRLEEKLKRRGTEVP